MSTIKNITKKPVSVPLPGGKRLFLGPSKTGQVSTKAAEHPPLVALIEAGELEILEDDGGFNPQGRNAGPSGGSRQGHTPGGRVFKSGDG